jgi:hypothetical protein
MQAVTNQSGQSEEDRGNLRQLREHALRCKCCGPNAHTYERELSTAIEAAHLPDALATKIRCRLCKAGQRFLDTFLCQSGKTGRKAAP